MKYLKTFENHDSIKSEIEDVLLELKDDYFEPTVTVSKDYKTHIFLNIINYQSKSAKWELIKDTIFRINNMLQGQFTPRTTYYKIIQPDGRIFNKGSRDIESWEEFDEFVTLKDPTLCFFSLEYVEVHRRFNQ